MPRIASVEAFLNKAYRGDPGVLISPACRYLRKAMNGAYHYEKDPRSLGEEYKPMPVKNFYSHVSDSLQMLCMYIGEKEIRDKRREGLYARMGGQAYRPASYEAGY
jgi:hypothetical protein